jgi:hypothetical protein
MPTSYGTTAKEGQGSKDFCLPGRGVCHFVHFSLYWSGGGHRWRIAAVVRPAPSEQLIGIIRFFNWTFIDGAGSV